MTEPFYNFTLQKCNAYTVPQREGPRGRSPPPKYSIPKFVARFSTLDSVILTEGTNFAINYKEPRPVIYTRTHTHTLSHSLSLSGATAQRGPGPPHSRGFNITPAMTQHSRRNLYQTKHNTHKDRPLISAAGFEAATPARKLPQTLALDHSRPLVSSGIYTACTVSTAVLFMHVFSFIAQTACHARTTPDSCCARDSDKRNTLYLW